MTTSYKVGDELAFRCGSHKHYWEIAKIEKDRGEIVVRQRDAEQEYIDQMQGRAGSAGYGPRAFASDGLVLLKIL
jgi:hypothetical protein